MKKKEVINPHPSPVLQESTQKLNALLNATTQSALLIDRQGKIIAANEIVAKRFGKRAKDVIGKNAFALFSQDLAKSRKKRVEEVFLTKKPVHFEDKCLGRTLQNSFYPIFDSRNRVSSVFIYGEDITKQREIEERLLGLNQLRSRLIETHSLEEKLQLVTDAIVKLFPFDFARIWLNGPGDQCDSGCYFNTAKEIMHRCTNREECLHLVSSSGPYRRMAKEFHNRIPLGLFSVGQGTNKKTRNLLVQDISKYPNLHNPEWTQKFGWTSFAGYSLLSEDLAQEGILAIFSKQSVTQEENILLEDLANTTAQVIKTARMEEELRKSEIRYKSLVLTSPEAVSVTDLAGTITEVSHRTLEIHGFDIAQELIGKNAFELIAKKDRKRALKNMRRTQREGFIRGEEYQLLKKDGTHFLGELNAHLIKDKQGKPAAFIATTRDITEQKRTEQILQEELMFRTSVIENAAEGLSVGHAIKKFPFIKFTVWNDRMTELTGYTMDEINKKGWYQTIYPDPEYQKRAVDRMVLLRKGKDLRGEEWTITRADGEKRHVNISTSIVKTSGETVHILSLMEDISDRKKADQAIRESEKKYRDFVDDALVGVYRTDIDGNIDYANQALLDIFGFGTYEEFKREGVWKRYKNPKDRELLLRRLKEKGKVDGFEFKAVTKSGAIKNVLLSSYLEGNSLLGMIMDISSRIEAEQELKQSREKLKNLAAHLQKAREEERTAISRELHDELGQTLTALKMDLSWLKKRIAPKDNHLQEKLLSMMILTDNTIQTVKRIYQDLRPSLLYDLGLKDAIEWQVEEFKKRSDIKCKMVFNFDEINLTKDQSIAVFRILQEALTNVSRHAKATRVHISLKKLNSQLELKIKDDGIGITEEDLSSNKSYGIIGIRERTDYLKGKETIIGIPDKGTTIRVRIPLHQ